MNNQKLLALLIANANRDGPAPIRMDTTDSEAHIYVYDVIDSWYGASAAALVPALKDAGDKTIHLHINSPGGDVFEARAMASLLVAHPANIITHIDGLAASAATYLALAGSEVRISDGGLFMIHNSWTMTYGDKSELLKTADLLDKIDGTIRADYMRKTAADQAQVTAWMDAETWFTAQEALDAGFVDAIDPNSKAKTASARWNLSAYTNAPKTQQTPPEPDLSALIAQQTQRNRNRLRLLSQI